MTSDNLQNNSCNSAKERKRKDETNLPLEEHRSWGFFPLPYIKAKENKKGSGKQAEFVLKEIAHHSTKNI